MRKLVTIQKILDIIPIENADMIEVARVNGWTGIVKKNQFKIGDYCVFFEIDSFLPVRPEYEFLRKGCYKNVDGLGEGFRIRTMKLRGVLSQGLVMPLQEVGIYHEAYSVFKFSHPDGRVEIFGEHKDLSEMLGVIKYDPPVAANLAGMAKGNFPSYLRKTDEERLQNIFQTEFEQIYNHSFEITRKYDGSSMTVYKHNGEVGVCSRNLDLKLEQDGNSFVNLAKQSGILEAIPEGFAVSGELCAPGVQGNPEQLKMAHMYVFNVFDIASQSYLPPNERKEFFDTYLANCPNIAHVDTLGILDVTETSPKLFLDNLLEMADTEYKKENKAEGLVFKRIDGKFSFKVISNLWLLKEK